MSVNEVTLVGNLGQDPEVKTLQSGNKCANLSVATSEKWTDKQTGEKKEKTEWHRIVIWTEHSVNFAEKYLKKGDLVYIRGKLQTRKWQDQSGNDRYSTEIVVQGFRGDLQPMRTKSSGNGNGDPGSQESDSGAKSAVTKPAVSKPAMEDEIPF